MEVLVLFLGIIGTQLIHCTWETGDTSLLCLVLANNIGRGLLFILMTFLGYWISKNKDYLKQILIVLVTIYVTGFLFNVATEIVLSKTLSLKYLIGQFVRGTPGNIWIIYGLIVFCILIAVYQKVSNPKTKQAIKLIGGGYSIVALVIFCYANTYSGIVSFDNGFILKFFYRVLGTNRSPYVLGLPFMVLGGYISTFSKHDRSAKYSLYVPIVFFVMWCVEVYFIHAKTGNYNIYMSLFGGLFVARVFSLLSDYFDDTIDFKFFIVALLLFAIQYSTTQICFTLFSIDTLLLRLVFFVIYTLFVAIVFMKYYRRKNVQ